VSWLRNRLRRVRDDERGMTLIELLVATAAGAVVIAGVSSAVIVTLRESNRVASHVDANQRARLTMTRVIDQLHSACFAYEYSPIQSGSGSTALIFTHPTVATASKVLPIPVKSEILLSGTTLSQKDYAATTTAAPWSFAATPASTTTLMTGVSPISASIPVFRYFKYASGKVSTTPLAVPLSAVEAEKAVQVTVAFKVGPLKNALSATSDPNAATPIQNSALMRFTPSGFEPTEENRPCE
jgi:prepilin-type N-terminal cleavage/methylation domain-containing protein